MNGEFKYLFLLKKQQELTKNDQKRVSKNVKLEIPLVEENKENPILPEESKEINLPLALALAQEIPIPPEYFKEEEMTSQIEG